MNQADFTPYAHSAAGHEGLSSNASGSLIIKPCTQAEIEFYESAKDHPEFQAHMPTYMGKLMLNNDTQVQVLANAPTANDNSIATAVDDVVDVKQLPGLKVEDGQLKVNSPTTKTTRDWTPSGGKKLSTGLGIVLENATTGFKKPNVLDLKLGSRLWADDAPEAKRQKLDQVAAETTTGSLGFRVAGMKVWQGDTSSSLSSSQPTHELHTTTKDDYKSFDKLYGRSLASENISSAFIAFFGGKSSSTIDTNTDIFTRASAPLLIRRLLRELKSIKYVLESTESRMYSASILIVLEGDDKALSHAIEVEMIDQLHEETDGIYEDDNEDDNENGDDDDDEGLAGPRVLEVRLIDFAHAQWTPGLGPDENALKGVRSIIGIVEGLLNSCVEINSGVKKVERASGLDLLGGEEGRKEAKRNLLG